MGPQIGLPSLSLRVGAGSFAFPAVGSALTSSVATKLASFQALAAPNTLSSGTIIASAHDTPLLTASLERQLQPATVVRAVVQTVMMYVDNPVVRVAYQVFDTANHVEVRAPTALLGELFCEGAMRTVCELTFD